MIEETKGVSALESNAQEVSPASTEQVGSQDLLKNLKAEMNRKVSRLTEEISKLRQTIEPKATHSVEEANDVPVTTKDIDARLALKAHQTYFEGALSDFPELDQKSDEHDPEFYALVDKFYTTAVKADPTDADALKDAIERAAVRTGKAQKLVQAKVMKDEARRSRIIAEGGSTPREQKTEKEVSLNDKGLARLGINPDKLKARLKSNKDKYGDL